MYHPPHPDAEYDPNHPPQLDISASRGAGSLDAYDQERSIDVYGIAGRVWYVSLLVFPYSCPCD